MKKLLKVVLPVVVLVLSLVVFQSLVQSKPEPRLQEPEPKLRLVRAVEVSKRDYPLSVSSQGTVTARAEVTLTAQVSGEVVEVSPALVKGGFFSTGDVLLRLDPRDYELAADRDRAEVKQAESRLEREQAEAAVARRDWEEAGLGEPNRMVLREPQVAEAEAGVAAARAQLAQTELELERTAITASFPGRVLEKDVDVGQFVTAGAALATLSAIDYAEVELPVPNDQLAFLDLSLGDLARGLDGEGPEVELRARFSGEPHVWKARIVRTAGSIDPKNRMLHLITRIEDPYGLRGNSDSAPLPIGLFVQAEIAGRIARDVVVLPRIALRSQDRVLVAEGDDRLRFRPVVVAWTTGDRVVVSEGLEAGEWVCTSPLEVAVDGMRVRIQPEEVVP